MTTPLKTEVGDCDTAMQVPLPVLYNTFKHHANALRHRVEATVAGGEPALVEVCAQLTVLGTRLMDMYTGPLTPRDVSAWVSDELRRLGRFELPAFREWVAGQGDYATITHPDEQTAWVLRLGDEQGRYVHLHPGRWSPNTLRVRANAVKTAFVAVAFARLHGGDPMSRRLLNEVRERYLLLPPLGSAPEGDLGLGVLIRLLSSETEG